MYREAFECRTPREPRFDYGVLAAVVSCFVIWAGFVYVLWSWAS